jgi:hypothetical protein
MLALSDIETRSHKTQRESLLDFSGGGYYSHDV